MDCDVIEETVPARPWDSRSPRTELQVANDVVFGVVAVDLLFRHDRLDTEVLNSFRRAVYDPVLDRLRVLADHTTPQARSPAKSWRLQDRILERQFSLGPPFTEEAAVDLNMVRPRLPFGEARLGEARRQARSLLRVSGAEATDDPVSSALIAWIGYTIAIGPGSETVSCDCRTRPFGYGDKAGVSEWLLPVFVEHDRSPHSERMALVYLGKVIKNKGGKLHPDDPIKGATYVYASHTPCISCLAVFCQFKRKLPGVRLTVIFDDWQDTRRWFDDGKAAALAEAATAVDDEM